MVGQMGGSQNYTASEKMVLAIAAVASDPKGTKARLEEISSARAQMEAQAKESADRLKAAVEAESKLAAAVNEFEARIASETEEIEAQRRQINQDWAAMDAVSRRLDEERVDFQETKRLTEKALSEREKTLEHSLEVHKRHVDELAAREAELEKTLQAAREEKAAYEAQRARILKAAGE